MRFGDVLINSTGVGTLGRVAQIYEYLDDYTTTVDTHVTIVRPKEGIDIDYFGLSILALEHYFESQGIGATNQTELGRERVSKTRFLRVPNELEISFGAKVQSWRKQALLLVQKNQNLRRTRDLLLPKLISGEVDVSQLEVAGVIVP